MNQKYLVANTAGLENNVSMCIKADPQNIAAFLVLNKDAPLITMETLGDEYFLLNARLGFIDRCFDQEFLRTELLPVLVHLQLGEMSLMPIDYVSSYEDLPVDFAPLPDWNAWRNDGISDKDFSAFRASLVELLLEEQRECEDEEIER